MRGRGEKERFKGSSKAEGTGHAEMSFSQYALMAVAALTAFAFPVVFALVMGAQQAREDEEHHALDLGRIAIAQIDKTGVQIAAAASSLNRLTLEEACSVSGLKKMQMLDLESTLLQGIGWVEGNTLLCSSFAGNRSFPLGPVDYVSVNNARVRTHAHLIDQRTSFVVVQSGAVASIVHPDLALSFVDSEPGLALVSFTWSRRIPVLRRGEVPADLDFSKLVPGTTRLENETVQAVIRSARSDMGVAVLIPAQSGKFSVGDAQRELLPTGIVCGIIFATFVILAARNRSSLRGLIKSGLARNEFTLRYQPIIDLDSNRIWAVEALLRWDRGKGAEISPEIFIPVAEQRGLMPALTARVIELLEQDLPILLDAAPDIEIAVNLSAEDLQQEAIPATLVRLAERTGLALDRLILEATERTLLDTQMASPALEELRSRGVRVAIDDFGTGYSSLAYLAVMEVDILKIDKLFIHALGTGSATSDVAQVVIEMARTLNLITIAEGIETSDQESLVRALAVKYGQGFHFSSPLLLDELADRLRKEQGPPMNRSAADQS